MHACTCMLMMTCTYDIVYMYAILIMLPYTETMHLYTCTYMACVYTITVYITYTYVDAH